MNLAGVTSPDESIRWDSRFRPSMKQCQIRWVDDVLVGFAASNLSQKRRRDAFRNTIRSSENVCQNGGLMTVSRFNELLSLFYAARFSPDIADGGRENHHHKRSRFGDVGCLYVEDPAADIVGQAGSIENAKAA